MGDSVAHLGRARKGSMISAIVLAAGTSSRMGEPKPLLRISEKPLLAHALESVHRSRVGHVIVVLGAGADSVRQQVSLDDSRVVVNPDYAAGLSTSLRAGLQAAPSDSDGYLIVLGDQPFVSSDTIDSLLERSVPTGPNILIPTYRGVRGNPVLLHRSFSPEVAALHGDIGCRAIFDDHLDQIIEVPVDDPGILFDIDTPEQLAALRKELEEGQSLSQAVATLVLEEFASRAREAGRREGARVRARQDVLALAHDLESRRESFSLATVVRATRPTSGKPGNRAIVRLNGEMVGWVGGSCTEAAVLAEGLAAIRDGRSRLLRLSKDPNAGPPQDGVVEYYMECHSGGSMDIYIEPHGARPRLLIVGDSPIADSLAGLGRLMNYEVVLVAPKATADAFPDADQVEGDVNRLPGLVAHNTYAVVATMGKYDGTALRALAPAPVAYLGLVASRRRAAAVLDELRRDGVAESALAKMRNPAGLDLAALTPEEIALSIMAEIVRVRRSETPEELPVVEEAPEAERSGMLIDVVCGMQVDPATPLKVVHDGTTYAFCSESCKSRFLESPRAFLH